MSSAADVAMLEAAGIELHATVEPWTALAGDVLRGLLSTPKTLPPKWFYDARGSELFEQITELAEYYPTRAEHALLERVGPEIAELLEPRELMELGSGSSTKTRLLLDPMTADGELARYLPVDVSAAAIQSALPDLAERYPGIAIEGHVCDFTTQLDRLDRPPSGRRLVALLGGTIGNLQPVEVREFLGTLRPLLGPEDALLMGTDLVKDPAVLEAAYDDSRGVTAEFNRNVLAVINRELGADFELEAFRHEALYNPALERIELRLRSQCAQVVRIEGLGTEVTFLDGESILTEISRKFTRETVERGYRDGGFALREWYEAPDGAYALSLASPA